MILADTSAWVEYDRSTQSRVDRRMTRLIRQDGPLAVTEPVMMEVLGGAGDDAGEEDLRRLLLRFDWIPFDPVVDFDGAVRIYRTCRGAGVTPCGLVDCMVAAVASRHNATILAHDVDLARVAKVFNLRLDRASLRP